MLFEDCENCENKDCENCEEGVEEFYDDEAIITMVDADSGEEYQFALVDDFDYKDQSYCVLVTLDEEDPEMVITKVVKTEDGEEGLMSLDEAEADEIYAEYDRLCEEAELEDEEDISGEEE
ncbi:MAG: DUF1292 domain-containing protein [Clostridiales bacterium]|nr:DUF1292 domain-containing protein [Candidatus Scatonaster coprocaballi]